MSLFRRNFATTASDRRERNKKGGETSKQNEVSNENKNGGTGKKGTEKSSDFVQITKPTGEQHDILPDPIENCFSCDKLPRKTVGFVTCKGCSNCFCHSCAELTQNTVKDIAKYRGLFWFCRDCILHENFQSFMQHPKFKPPPSDSTVTLVNTQAGPLEVVDATIAEPLPQTEDPLLNRIVTAVQILQTEVCGIKDLITADKSSHAPTKKSYAATAAAAAIATAPNKTTHVEQTEPRAQTQKHVEQTDNNKAQQLTERQRKIQESLQARQKAPRPQVAAEVMEAREAERRKYNVVIHNLEENISESAEERKEHDEFEVSCMLAGARLFNVNVKKAIRLGNRSEDKPGPRPLLVTLDADREKIIKRQGAIRGFIEWKGVFIDPDRTPQEQEDHKALRQEFKRRKDAGENVKFRNGKIVTSNRENSPLQDEQQENNEQQTAASSDSAKPSPEVETPQDNNEQQNEAIETKSDDSTSETEAPVTKN